MKKLFFLFALSICFFDLTAQTVNVPAIKSKIATNYRTRSGNDSGVSSSDHRTISGAIADALDSVQKDAQSQINQINDVLPLKVNAVDAGNLYENKADAVYKYNYEKLIRAQQDSILNANKLNKSEYVNADWNATTGKAAIQNKPNLNGITAQWSFLGNALEGNSEAFLGTTDQTELKFKVAGVQMLRLGTETNISFLNSNASGNSSVAMGNVSTASGEGSLSMGSASTASGSYSVAMGSSSNASGWYSVAIGNGSNSKAVNSVAIGSFNDQSDSPLPTASLSDRVFQVGNGDDMETSNAITVLRNGNTSIGNDYTPNEKLVVAGNTYLSQQGSGLIQKSPNGGCWKLMVTNAGVVVANSIPCPN
jgi:hypothetical protein